MRTGDVDQRDVLARRPGEMRERREQLGEEHGQSERDEAAQQCDRGERSEPVREIERGEGDGARPDDRDECGLRPSRIAGSMNSRMIMMLTARPASAPSPRRRPRSTTTTARDREPQQGRTSLAVRIRVAEAGFGLRDVGEDDAVTRREVGRRRRVGELDRSDVTVVGTLFEAGDLEALAQRRGRVAAASTVCDVDDRRVVHRGREAELRSQAADVARGPQRHDTGERGQGEHDRGAPRARRTRSETWARVPWVWPADTGPSVATTSRLSRQPRPSALGAPVLTAVTRSTM